MDWRKLLTEERFYWPRDLHPDRRPEVENKSWVFQQDSARISSSSAFRRLQAKTQVLPFPKTDYPRSRLTHTIEVSNIGRRLALNIARSLVKRETDDNSLKINFDNEFLSADFVSGFVEVTAAACLAHDIGNPPFGHAGEDSIKLWFRERLGSSLRFQNIVPDKEDQINDFLKFDGNAQGHRIVTFLQGWGTEGGLQLSLAVLGAFAKYPRTSDFAVKDKFGVMATHREQSQFVFESLGLKLISSSSNGGFSYSRHPLAYIVEAADDIAYVTADLEDAVRGGVVEFSEAENKLMSIASRSDDHKTQQQKMKRYGGIGLDSSNAKLRYLRTHAITEMVRETERIFIEKYVKIMNGEYTLQVEPDTKEVRQYGELLKDSMLGDKISDIKTFSSRQIHNARGKIDNEVAGKNIIFGLLDMFASVFSKLYASKSIDGLAEIDRKLALIFPWDNYTNTANLDDFIRELKKEDMLYMLVDFVSGMTDRYASSMFRQLSGNQQPFANW